ncbi:MAG: MSMEG_6728 family protein [Gemmatimonadaceae bacterium]
MNTFLPYADFEAAARALDERRLGKQRVEGFQILRAIHIPTYGWQNHPAVRMWRGHEGSLLEYTRAMCREWVLRGHPDTVSASIEREFAHVIPTERYAPPSWLGDRDLHLSHQSNLLRKDPDFYRARFGDIPPGLPYVWPV